jgi:hypothetical protein
VRGVRDVQNRHRPLGSNVGVVALIDQRCQRIIDTQGNVMGDSIGELAGSDHLERRDGEAGKRGECKAQQDAERQRSPDRHTISSRKADP